MESKQIQTCSIIWNYSSYLAGVFYWKIISRTKHNWHCTIGFLILFFRKEYILFWNVYISVNTIFECCYSFFSWEISHPLSACITEGILGWGTGVGGSSKMCTGAYRKRGVSCLMCTCALAGNYSFNVFVLRYLVLTFIKKMVFLYIFESPQKAGIRFS